VLPIQYPSPDTLNTAFIECHRCIQALRALGEGVTRYGGVIVPKILGAFPGDLFRRLIVHAKREGLSEGDNLSLMTFQGEEVDGALTTHKIRCEATNRYAYTPTAATLHYSQNLEARPGGPPRRRDTSASLVAIGHKTAKGWWI
jgi:hypothetical protein